MPTLGRADHTLPLIKTIVFKQAIHRNNLIYLADAGWTMFYWIGSDQGVEELLFGARQLPELLSSLPKCIGVSIGKGVVVAVEFYFAKVNRTICAVNQQINLKAISR